MKEHKDDQNFELSCPLPIHEYPRVTLAHGGGGSMSNKLVRKMFIEVFGDESLRTEHDGAIFPVKSGKMAFSTDSFVVDPLFFPGGDIGEMAINGTVNDILCCGARPLYISVSFILEEGLEMETLWRIALSVKAAAENAGVRIVTGDTKVVDKGKADKIFINTSAVGEVFPHLEVSPTKCSDGDAIILSGRLAEHGIAVMSKREGLSFESGILSDTAALTSMMLPLFDAGIEIHALRDPTRGGLASSLNEICSSGNCGATIFEEAIPLTEAVKGACEILGFDPLYVANEGKMVIIAPRREAEKILDMLHDTKQGRDAAIIGRITRENPGLVRMRTEIGSTRIVDMMSGEQLPRIC